MKWRGWDSRAIVTILWSVLGFFGYELAYKLASLPKACAPGRPMGPGTFCSFDRFDVMAITGFTITLGIILVVVKIGRKRK